MSNIWIIISSLAYLVLLFGIAFGAERLARRGSSVVTNPLIYALSLGVYCTAWTYYGSVGRAAVSGIGFLPIYLGPTILAPLWILVLRKIILISKTQRITSVADFISSRYGKSTTLGTIATLIAVLSIIPYISIQLKAISSTFNLLAGHPPGTSPSPIYRDSALYITIVLAFFTILFGTRNLDPNERHEGLVAAIAFESIFKLVAFLAVGFFVTFSLFRGPSDLFSQLNAHPQWEQLTTFSGSAVKGRDWLWLTLLSMSAILLLPRQFHVAVVENMDARFVGKASWIFPLYLLLINLFVLPIAFGGLILLGNQPVEPDTYILTLPLTSNQNFLALLVGLGGFSAASSMVIVAVIALSIMISNNLVLPMLLKPQFVRGDYRLTTPLLGIRRISIIIVLLLAYGYFRSVGQMYPLVSIGLISFTGIAQFLPATLGGIYWKRATKAGAITGLILGFSVWMYTLPFPTLVEIGWVKEQLIEEGPWGLRALNPYALFGWTGVDHITHSAFWSIAFNTFGYVGVSLCTQPKALEITQADLYVDIYKYQNMGVNYEVLRRRARVRDLTALLDRFVGEARRRELLKRYQTMKGNDLQKNAFAPSDLVNYVETHLSGAIGAAAAKVIVASIVKEDPISLEEIFKILDQTQEIMDYSKALERKSAELEMTTRQLKQANAQLQELDRLKADFITTVTHELRTPITSIKAISQILHDHPDIEPEKKNEFLGIVIGETNRITRLINQVLDLEKIHQAGDRQQDHKLLSINQLVYRTYQSMQQLMTTNNINTSLALPEEELCVYGNEDQLVQALVNLLSNAAKFADPNHGLVAVTLSREKDTALIEVADNGPGIPQTERAVIFEKFTQVHHAKLGKPKGSGLGLYITRMIVDYHGGSIQLADSELGGACFQIRLLLHLQTPPQS